MGLIFLVGLIVLLANMPKIYRSTPDQFPVNDPDAHARWKKTFLRSHYAFLGAIAAFGIAVTVMTSVVDPKGGSTSEVSPLQSAAFFIGILGPIPVLIWAVILNRKAMRLKEIIEPPGTATNYYQRYAPPQVAPPPQPKLADTDSEAPGPVHPDA